MDFWLLQSYSHNWPIMYLKFLKNASSKFIHLPYKTFFLTMATCEFVSQKELWMLLLNLRLLKPLLRVINLKKPYDVYIVGEKLKMLAELKNPVNKWVKVFKNEPSKVCGRQLLKNLRWCSLPKQTISLQTF